ncbi:type IV secretory system conjugative DNA transfer family protein [Xenococcus sp. PCC 7305]|uniref:type IV secretory system conjugative DNA transfer family protein n=1 Tax=Xenococcus sp. PCC 7305 TaxID=102125 RepID=UPI00130D5091|nr:type IV secretion system DNA-binding domain-containing protein [Xenococcus sp. PCC 7305]
MNKRIIHFPGTLNEVKAALSTPAFTRLCTLIILLLWAIITYNQVQKPLPLPRQIPSPADHYLLIALLSGAFYLFFALWKFYKYTCYYGWETRWHYWGGLGIYLILLKLCFVKIHFLAGGLLYVLTVGSIPHWIVNLHKEVYALSGVQTTVQFVRSLYTRLRADGETGVLFGGVYLPLSALCTYMLVIGSVGAGKTITLRLALQDLIPLISPGSNLRCIIYDPKLEFYGLIYGMGVSSPVYILFLFDARAHAWDIAVDTTSPADIISLMYTLFPKQTGHQNVQDFFVQAARNVLGGIVEIFNDLAPGQWTWRDLYWAITDRKLVIALLKSSPQTCHLVEYFAYEKLAASVMTTIYSQFQPFRTIFALSDYHYRQGRKFSAKNDWNESESVVILGKNEEYRDIVTPFNQLFLRKAAMLALDSASENSQTARYIFVIDEATSLKQLEFLDSLIQEGRSHGVVLLFAFQSVETMKHYYGEAMANALLGQFRYKAILKLSDPVSAYWAAQIIGQMTIYHKGADNSYQSIPTATEFQFIKPVDRKLSQGLTGYYCTQFHTHQHYYRSRVLKSKLQEPAPEIDNFIPIADSQAQILQPWNHQDLQRLKIANIVQSLNEQSTQDLAATAQEVTAEVIPAPEELSPELQSKLKELNQFVANLRQEANPDQQNPLVA